MITALFKCSITIAATALGGFFLLNSSAHAITTTSTVPRGVRVLGWINASSSIIDSRLNSRGNLEALARSVNRSLSLADFAKTEPRLGKLRDVLNELSPKKLGNELLLTNLYADVSVQESRSVGAFFWGLTDQLMVGVLIPKISRNYRANFRAETVNNAASIRNKIGRTPQLDEGLKQLAEYSFDTAMFEDKIFKTRGFQPLRDFEASGLGDIEAEMNYRYFESAPVDLMVRTTVRFPTASHRADLTNLMDRELGDGSVAFKLGSLHTVRLVPEFLSFQSALFGTWHAPSRVTLAIPKSPSDDLADLNDPEQIEEVRRHYGAQLELDTGLQFDVWKGLFCFAGSYQFSTKTLDNYRGSRGLDYARLINETDSSNHSYEIYAEFSAIPLFKKKLVPIPGKLAFTWHEPLGGKNTTYASYGRLDAIVFF